MTATQVLCVARAANIAIRVDGDDLILEAPAPPDHTPSTKELAAVGRALSGRRAAHDVERCPHCGEVIRVRGKWRPSTADIVNEWLRERTT